jgi:hypothetical protein
MILRDEMGDMYLVETHAKGTTCELVDPAGAAADARIVQNDLVGAIIASPPKNARYACHIGLRVAAVGGQFHSRGCPTFYRALGLTYPFSPRASIHVPSQQTIIRLNGPLGAVPTMIAA